MPHAPSRMRRLPRSLPWSGRLALGGIAYSAFEWRPAAIGGRMEKANLEIALPVLNSSSSTPTLSRGILLNGSRSASRFGMYLALQLFRWRSCTRRISGGVPISPDRSLNGGMRFSAGVDSLVDAGFAAPPRHRPSPCSGRWCVVTPPQPSLQGRHPWRDTRPECHWPPSGATHLPDYQSCAKGALDESALTKATCLALEKGTPTEQVTETLPITAQFKQDCPTTGQTDLPRINKLGSFPLGNQPVRYLDTVEVLQSESA